MAHVFRKPLLATEHSEQDRGAEEVAFALAQRWAVTLGVVLPIVSNPEYETLAPQLAAHADAQARERLDALAAGARRSGVELELRPRRGPEPYREIVDEAAACGADLLVIRRRGKRGLLANLLVGEMVRNVVAHAPCSVLVVPRVAQMWSKRVFAGVDPATGDLRPATDAAAVARECGLPLTIAAVCAASTPADREAAGRVLEGAAQVARASGVEAETIVLAGRVHEQLIDAATRCGADLIVIGRHGATQTARAWIGGVAQKVIGLAERPVLVSVGPPVHPGART